MKIPIYQKEDFEKMRIIGVYANKLLDEIEKIIKPGISTQDIDDYSYEFIKKHSLKSACLGYKGQGDYAYPANICTSVNHVVCHGIPNKNHILKESDIISVDITLIKDEYHADTCRTFAVGNISKELKELIETTKNAMEIGIKQCYPGNFLNNIGYSIQEYVKSKKKYSIVEDYCGHGICKVFHQPPQIEHVGQKDTGPIIKPGMIFTIEPMLNLGLKDTKLLNDHWTVITKDYSYSAQFEHTLGITESGVEIFTS